MQGSKIGVSLGRASSATPDAGDGRTDCRVPRRLASLVRTDDDRHA